MSAVEGWLCPPAPHERCRSSRDVASPLNRKLYPFHPPFIVHPEVFTDIHTGGKRGMKGHFKMKTVLSIVTALFFMGAGGSFAQQAPARGGAAPSPSLLPLLPGRL